MRRVLTLLLFGGLFEGLECVEDLKSFHDGSAAVIEEFRRLASNP